MDIHSTWRSRALPLLPLLSLSLLLAGCGSAGLSAGSQSQASSSSAGEADPADPPADPNANMVAAVNPSGGSGVSSPVDVKFRLEGRPEVGTPLKIMVAVIPATDAQIRRLHGAFLAGDGLALRSERTFDVADPQGGTALYREVTVVPAQTGVLSINATILVDLDKASQSRTYTIPLIAADRSS